jgi:trk system potassium uptake protein TrkA
MNIIIAGDGEVGLHLAKSLNELDFNITVIGPPSDLLERLKTATDVLTIAGDPTSPAVLSNANVDDCDLFISVLHDEPFNLISCMLAHKLKAKKTVARITNAELLAQENREMFRDLGVDEMVCPERIAAKEITNLLNNNVATDFFDFSGGLLTMYLIRLESESQIVGRSVRELVQTYTSLQVRVVAILRNSETIIPHPDFTFQTGDLAYIISKPNQMESVMKLVGKTDVNIRNVMIAGGGRIGRYAAINLENRMHIKLVECDPARCNELSTILKKTLVLKGDATDIEFLKDEGLENNDAFLAVTDSSETNVLTCLHARRLGVKRTIALVENTGFINISQDVGIDTIINKKLITASYIARFIVKGSAISSKWLSGTNAELIELVVGRRAPATRKPIGELHLPVGSTVGGIIRGRETLLPTRETQLQEKDKVVVFTLPKLMNQVSRIFE